MYGNKLVFQETKVQSYDSGTKLLIVNFEIQKPSVLVALILNSAENGHVQNALAGNCMPIYLTSLYPLDSTGNYTTGVESSKYAYSQLLAVASFNGVIGSVDISYNVALLPGLYQCRAINTNAMVTVAGARIAYIQEVPE